MDDSAFAVKAQDGEPGDSLAHTPHSVTTLLDVVGPVPAGTDVVVTLHDGRRVAYAPGIAGPDSDSHIVPNVLMRGNGFAPVHDSPRALGALLSIAAGRRVATGPESERVIVFIRGTGLVFLQNEDTLRFEPGSLVALPPGEPARVWAQGPEDVLAVVLQPKGVAGKRRTLASEILRRREPHEPQLEE